MKDPEGLVFFGGPIRTLRDDRPLVEAVGVRGDRIAAAGSRAEVEAALTAADGRRPRRIDLKGAALFPGLVDSHTHIGSLGLRFAQVDLEGVATLERALELVAKHAANVGPGKWVRGGGWNKNLWPGGRFPTRHDLDRIVPDRPVSLASKDGHSLWVNTEALRRAGVTRETSDPPGGAIERDAAGEPTGILKENAGDLVFRVAEQPSAADYRDCIKRAIAAAHARGVVGTCDMEGRESFKAYQSLVAAGELRFRVWLYVPEELLPGLAAIGLESGFGGDYLKIAGVKAFLDGVLGSQTADMLAPYEGTDSRGIPTMSAEAFTGLVARAAAEGLAVAVHAIGDRANRKALDGFEANLAASRAAGLRHRIEHAQLVHPDDLPRLARLGVVASMQPIHAPSDQDIADRHWGTRPGAYAWRSLLDNGARLVFGSDAPVETIDPLQGVFAAVTRRHPQEPERPPWRSEEAVTPLEAVKAYCTGAAWAVAAENERGTIEPGKLADFTILSDDLLSGDVLAGADGPRGPERLLRARAVATVVGGKFVFGEL